jgi:tetratricopeptide (TPR) repeat protein
MTGSNSKILNVIKIIYYTIAYFAVGLTVEEYHIRKANYWINLGNYRRAIRNYQKSLKESEDSEVRAAMAWCYSQIGMYETSLDHYRKAFERNRHPSIALRLAYAELNVGNLTESERLLKSIQPNIDKMHIDEIDEMKNLEKYINEEKITKN